MKLVFDLVTLGITDTDVDMVAATVDVRPTGQALRQFEVRFFGLVGPDTVVARFLDTVSNGTFPLQFAERAGGSPVLLKRSLASAYGPTVDRRAMRFVESLTLFATSDDQRLRALL